MDTELPPLVGGGAIVSDVTVNMGVQISVQVPALDSLGYIPRSKLLIPIVILYLIF